MTHFQAGLTWLRLLLLFMRQKLDLPPLKILALLSQIRITGVQVLDYGMNVTAGTSSSLIIDSLGFFNTTGFTASDFKIYYRIGTHVGFESNASSWILASDLEKLFVTWFWRK
jgi:hypothetical protein